MTRTQHGWLKLVAEKKKCQLVAVFLFCLKEEVSHYVLRVGYFDGLVKDI